MKGLIIWDFRNTIYNTDKDEFETDAIEILEHVQSDYKNVLALCKKRWVEV